MRPVFPVKFRSYLGCLVAAVLLPVLSLAAYLSAVSASSQMQSVEQGMRETARALSLAVDGQVAVAMSTLDALVVSASFRTGNYEAFRTQAEQFLSQRNGWLSVVDQDGQQHLNTRLPRDAPLPKTDNTTWLNNVFGATRFFVTGAVTGPVVKQPFV